jgi:hypothetical protein
MGMTYEQRMQMQRACVTFQERADAIFQHFGLTAPAPVVSDDAGYADTYRRKLARMARNQLPENHELRQARINSDLRADAFNALEPLIYAACMEAAKHPYVQPGVMRTVKTKNPDNGQVTNTFHGEWFGHLPGLGTPIDGFGGGCRAGRRVKSFLFDRSALRS